MAAIGAMSCAMSLASPNNLVMASFSVKGHYLCSKKDELPGQSGCGITSATEAVSEAVCHETLLCPDKTQDNRAQVQTCSKLSDL
jgi:hypothetical protein